jgi:hypothetical protein
MKICRVTDFPQVSCYLIAVGTFPLEADTCFKVVGCLEYILHNIWELLTDFSALPSRTAFWVDMEFKIEQIRRKTLYIKHKDGNPSIESTRQMRARVDTTQKEEKKKELKESWTTVQQLLEALGAQLKIGNLTQNGGEMP